MKTTFAKLFTLIALTMIVAGSSLNTVSAQGRLISGILSEVLGDQHCHHPSHQHNHGFNRPYGNQNYNEQNFQPYNGGDVQYQQQQPSPPPMNKLVPPPMTKLVPPPMTKLVPPPMRSTLPDWLVGKWQLLDRRVGGATQYEISADGRFTTINLVTGTAAGTFESGRSTQTVSYSPNGLLVGNKLFELSSTEPGKLTLNSTDSSFQIQRIESPVSNIQPVANSTPVNSTQSADGSRVPVAMHGTWYEIARNSRGEQILNRYVFSPAGTYDLLQYAISAEGDVDLGQPLAQLSKMASAQQRTVSITPQAVMTLAAGERFAEGPLQLVSEVDSQGQVTVLHLGDRKLTRQP